MSISTMIDVENTNHRISPEIRRLERMKENRLTDRFKTVKTFDLNLLTTFEAVFIHRSGTKAADALGITPSAVSQALGRLRVHFNDALFLRDGKALAPTTVAIGIHEGLEDAYDNLIAKLQNISFDTVPTRLVVHCAAYISMFTLNVMRRVLDEIAPECEIVHTISHNTITEIEESLIFRKADIIFDMHSHVSHSRVSQQISSETPVVICRRQHPRIDDTLRLEQIPEEKFIYIDSESAVLLSNRIKVNSMMRENRVCRFISPSLLTNISMVESSDMLAIVPERFYEKMKNSFEVKALDVDFAIPSQPVYLIYNKSALNNQFFATLVKKMTDIFQEELRIEPVL
ncbi:LysR family transcriptional regulator [Scandinavium sp. V105_16]|uniref:LysR family transcriptional regulator n=1 Tax=Scandinavium lactucae TaxID=3095028 RepID=A0AAJ2VU79_9ENTR|nr:MULTISPECIES: LysR family transcriptional regulator [unclassified Scandinavium]MDX6021498.1 LysR family transcriptional regulator [Scandinavium sp. V105_16]MDX6031663.1 LysR family transcriptional regulator [Scandinavium sp. V105_12]